MRCEFLQLSMRTRVSAKAKKLRRRFVNWKKPAWPVAISKTRNFRNAVAISPGKRSSILKRWLRESRRRSQREATKTFWSCLALTRAQSRVLIEQLNGLVNIWPRAQTRFFLKHYKVPRSFMISPKKL